MKIKNVGIIGIGSYTPEKIIKNEDIDQLNIGTNSDWTYKNLGIKERKNVINELPSDLAYYASLNAINDANINKNDIDLIILATSSPDRISPSTACILASKLDIKCAAFDINAVCSGFIYGIQLASNLIQTNQYKNILLVGADAYSRITDWSDRNCVFFGDGAGAVIISNVENSWITTNLYGDGSGKEGFTCHHSSKFHMNAGAVYNFATKVLPEAINKILLENNLTNDDIDWMVPHQPGHRVLFKTSELLNFPNEKVVFNMASFGNTAGASIPMALDRIYKDGSLKSGNIILMPAVGSGWTWGVSLLKYIK
jgi:3-oxoacyl-[acyl-carrier-protein] synthase-3